MGKIFLVTCILCSWLTAFAQSNALFSEDDINRILYMSSARGRNQRLTFLVLDRVGIDKRTLTCHLYGSSRVVTVKSHQVKRLPFYENSPTFMVTQYAIDALVQEKKVNPAWELSRLNRSASNRVVLIEKFRLETSGLNRFFSNLLRDNSLENEDRVDTVIDTLEKSQLPSIINSALTSCDAVLAIYLCDQLRIFLESYTIRRIVHKKEYAALILPFLNKSVEAVLANLQQKINGQNMRREQFQKLFPQARGVWSGTPPMNFNDLCRLFRASMRSYFRLDRISKLTSPMDWGSAVLDVLLLTEGSPDVSELEKEFDQELRRWTMLKQTNKTGF